MKPPQETQPAAPRVVSETPTPRVVDDTPTPRVVNETPTPRVNTKRQSKVKATIDKPMLTKEKSQKRTTEHTPERALLKEYL